MSCIKPADQNSVLCNGPNTVLAPNTAVTLNFVVKATSPAGLVPQFSNAGVIAFISNPAVEDVPHAGMALMERIAPPPEEQAPPPPPRPPLEACAAIPLDPKVPVQTGPLTVAKKGQTKCEAKDPCVFTVTVTNTSDAPIKGPIHVNEQIEAPNAGRVGEPAAPWVCSKTAPFTCTHPGPLAPKASLDLQVAFGLNLPPGTKSVKNCALVADGSSANGNIPGAGGGAGGDIGPGNVGIGGKFPPTPEQCAIVPVEDEKPPGGGGGKEEPGPVAEKPKDGAPAKATNGLEVTKRIIPGACTADGCVFRVTIKNTTKAEIPGPITFIDQLNGRIGAEQKFFKTAINSGPDAPWKCGPQPGSPVHFICTHPGPIAAGATLTATMNMKLVDAATSEALSNCAIIEQVEGKVVGSCATAPLGKPNVPPAPSVAGALSLTKTFVDCDTNNICSFKITLKNTGAQPFQGSAQFADELTGDGALFGNAVLRSPRPFTCTKQGQSFVCKADGLVIPVGGSIERTFDAFLGAGTGAVKEMKNCATLEGAPAPSCATAVLGQPNPPPGPADGNSLVLAKTRAAPQGCSEIGGGCEFNISITNAGAQDFEGPVAFTERLTTSAGQALPDAKFDNTPIIVLADKTIMNLVCDKAGDAFTCGSGGANVKIPAGKAITAKIAMKPGATGGAEQLRNCAQLTSGGPESCAEQLLVKGPLLRMTKMLAGDATCLPSCRFVVVFQNVGTTPARGVFKFEDKFSPGPNVLFDSNVTGAKCANINGRFICELDKQVFQPGEMTSVVLRVFASARAPEYVNCVEFLPQNFADPGNIVFDNSNDRRCVTMKDTSPQTPNLIINKKAPNAEPGKFGHCDLKSACRFTITVTNTGLAPFKGTLKVTDTVSKGTPEFINIGPGSPQSLPWSCTRVQNAAGAAFAQGSITCELPALPNGLQPGATATLEVAVTPGKTWKGSNFLENCASITSEGDLGANAVKTSCDQAELDPFAVKVTKTGDQSCQPGGDCRFRISLVNPGPIDHIAPVTITDQLTGLSSAQIVSITPASPADPFPCTPAPTQIPFTCTSPGDYPLMLGPDGEPGPPIIFDMVVRLPADASAEQFSNCASATDLAGGSSGQSCVTVAMKPEDKCFAGMILVDGACKCPEGTDWNGTTCDGTGGVNTTLLPVLTPQPEPVKCAANQILDKGKCVTPKAKPVVCAKNQVLDKASNKCIAVKPKPVVCAKDKILNKASNTCVCPKNRVLDKATNKCVRPKPKVCPEDRPVGKYPDCCQEGTEFRNGKCRPPRQQQNQQQFCEGDTPNGVFPNCCAIDEQFVRGRCRRVEQQPQQNDTPIQKTCPDGTVVFGQYTQCPNDKPVVRDCGEGYRTRNTPNQYGNYCDLIPVPGPVVPEQPTCRSSQYLGEDGRCYDNIN